MNKNEHRMLNHFIFIFNVMYSLLYINGMNSQMIKIDFANMKRFLAQYFISIFAAEKDLFLMKFEKNCFDLE